VIEMKIKSDTNYSRSMKLIFYSLVQNALKIVFSFVLSYFGYVLETMENEDRLDDEKELNTLRSEKKKVKPFGEDSFLKCEYFIDDSLLSFGKSCNLATASDCKRFLTPSSLGQKRIKLSRGRFFISTPDVEASPLLINGEEKMNKSSERRKSNLFEDFSLNDDGEYFIEDSLLKFVKNNTFASESRKCATPSESLEKNTDFYHEFSYSFEEFSFETEEEEDMNFVPPKKQYNDDNNNPEISQL